MSGGSLRGREPEVVAGLREEETEGTGLTDINRMSRIYGPVSGTEGGACCPSCASCRQPEATAHPRGRVRESWCATMPALPQFLPRRWTERPRGSHSQRRPRPPSASPLCVLRGFPDPFPLRLAPFVPLCGYPSAPPSSCSFCASLRLPIRPPPSCAFCAFLRLPTRSPFSSAFCAFSRLSIGSLSLLRLLRLFAAHHQRIPCGPRGRCVNSSPDVARPGRHAGGARKRVQCPISPLTSALSVRFFRPRVL